ncbi:hypothetical protein [Candidatus Uabimicrobium sp. HlEnr_7]|uniref:hypothetical protein n=1 Tax=Candidatus Uabimicrobium helgolandensis TaxID=3095367 RepID=UPI00355623B0
MLLTLDGKIKRIAYTLAILLFPIVCYDILKHSWTSYQIPYYDYTQYIRGQRNKELIHKKAIQKFKIVLAYEPRNYWAHLEIGRLYRKLHQTNPQQDKYLSHAQFHLSYAQQLIPYWGLPYLYSARICETLDQNSDTLMWKAQLLCPAHAAVTSYAISHWLIKLQTNPHNPIYKRFILNNLLFLNNYNAKKYGEWSLIVINIVFDNEAAIQKIIPQSSYAITQLIPALIHHKKFSIVENLLAKLDKHQNQKKILSHYLHIHKENLDNEKNIHLFFNMLFHLQLRREVSFYVKHLVPGIKKPGLFYAKLSQKFWHEKDKKNALRWIRIARKIQPQNTSFINQEQKIIQNKE